MRIANGHLASDHMENGRPVSHKLTYHIGYFWQQNVSFVYILLCNLMCMRNGVWLQGACDPPHCLH